MKKSRSQIGMSAFAKRERGNTIEEESMSEEQKHEDRMSLESSRDLQIITDVASAYERRRHLNNSQEHWLDSVNSSAQPSINE